MGASWVKKLWAEAAGNAFCWMWGRGCKCLEASLLGDDIHLGFRGRGSRNSGGHGMLR